jgi:hypothetical protein
MKVLALVLAAALALASFPAAARGSFHPHVSVGFGIGFPHYYNGPFGYDPWLYPYGYAPYPVRVYRDNKATDNEAVANLYAYPQAGQSEAKVAQDRSECHDWAVGQSDFDPATAKRPKDSDVDNYDRAFTACMAGRNYTVR